MERQILFRGKIKDGEWIYWNEFGEINFDLTDTEIALYVKDLNDELAFETVGQFTGLVDKNGKKVFEGDILATLDYDDELQIEGVVKYDKFNCSCCDGVYCWYIENGDIRKFQYDDVFVVGNIFDNKELLGE